MARIAFLVLVVLLAAALLAASAVAAPTDDGYYRGVRDGCLALIEAGAVAGMGAADCNYLAGLAELNGWRESGVRFERFGQNLD